MGFLIFAVGMGLIYLGLPWIYLKIIRAISRPTDVLYRLLHDRTGWYASFAAVAIAWGYGFTEWVLHLH